MTQRELTSQERERLEQWQAAVAAARERVGETLEPRGDDLATHPATEQLRAIGAATEPIPLERLPEPGDVLVRRLRIVGVCVAVLFLGLIGRVFSLQVLEHEQYRERWAQSQVSDPEPAVRGAILDRHGVPYAISRMSGQSLYAVPRLLDETGREELAEWVSETLGLERDAIHERLTRNHDKAFIWLKRHLAAAEEEAVAEAVRASHALGLRRETIRLYPQGRELAHVVGFTDIDGRGLEGLELMHNDRLAGTDGRRARLRDAMGRRLGTLDLPEEPARNGANVVLTVDHAIQALVEEQLDAIEENWAPSGAVILVMNPHTGEILGIGSRPGFDPTNRGLSTPEQRRNRAVTDAWEPGSIFKPMILAAALQDGRYRVPANLHDMPDDPFEPMRGEAVIDAENGSWTIRRGRSTRVLRDVTPYGRLPMRSVIIKSSNIAMAKIGLELGHDRLRHYLSAFGFGRPLGVDLPGEARGLMPPQEQIPELHTIPSVTMGHGISVSSLQVLSAFNSIVNGGYVLRPFVVSEIVGPDGEVIEQTPHPYSISRPLPDDAVREYMRQAMIRVCQPGGTARRANLDRYGISVAGKTGTAQRVVDGRYTSGNPLCAFLAFAPAEEPQLSVLVIVDEPTRNHEGLPFYGGTVAAPPAAEIILRTLTRQGYGKDE